MKWSLKDKKALVTGATKGIGYAIAEEFLSLGAELLIVARNQEEIEACLSAWRSQGHSVMGMACDLQSPKEREKLLESIKREWGSLDVLVNNAGTNLRKKTESYTLDEYQKVISVALLSIS